MPKHNSNVFTPTRHILLPIKPGTRLTLNLHRHSWHILGGPNSSLIAAFSNYDCAQLTAEHIIGYKLDHLSQLEKLTYVSSMRIMDTKSGIWWSREGKEWVPTSETVN